MAALFGPVLSRRLGRSLGIDLVPPKTCSMDCIYCECGLTNHLTMERKEWVPIQSVIEELDLYFASQNEVDYITFSGSGEPTLNTGIGRIIKHIKSHYPHKICLLTNSTTLPDATLRAELKGIDRIVPSLDGARINAFKAITRAEKSLDIQSIIRGIADFKKESPETYMALEIFIIPTLNDHDDDIAAFAEAVKIIQPDCVQLNTLDRPGCFSWIQKPTPECVDRFLCALSPICKTELIGKIDFSKIDIYQANPNGNLTNRILTTCGRRPCTLDDLKMLTGLTESILLESIMELKTLDKIIEKHNDGKSFFINSLGLGL